MITRNHLCMLGENFRRVDPVSTLYVLKAGIPPFVRCGGNNSISYLPEVAGYNELGDKR